MYWFEQGLCVLPAFLVVWSSATFIICYIIAIYRHDVDVIFPYISDTGVSPPESCIFGLMTFISACAGVGTIYARYKHVELLREDATNVSARLNKVALWLGVISCFGMCIVATFQETVVQVVHDIGAFLFFVFGIVYIILQCFISFQAHPYGCSKYVFCVRVTITILAAVAFVPSILFEISSVSIVQDYPFHVASAVCEWIVAFTFVFFFFTYIHDFKVSISLSHIVYSFLIYIYSFAKILLFLFSYSSLPYG
uniref:DNA damage regulated autophagy modulator 1 n=1 Tax=Pundamilia nyererei TaxID=303518 RepID=A0A3B4GI35_9CICH